MSARRVAARTGLLLLALLAALVATELFFRVSGAVSPAPLCVDAGLGRLRSNPVRDDVAAFQLAARPDRLRVLWLGDSTVVGVPWDPLLTPPRWLQWILDSRGLRAEVVGIAGPGLDATRVANLLEEALALHPDVVVVTTGHNEYLTLGASLHPRWWHSLRTAVRLQEALAGRPDAPAPGEVPDHEAVTARFASQLDVMAGMCAWDGVPLILTSPVCNLADMPPVLGGAASAGDADEAFAAGRAALAAGDNATAHAAFVRARDLDRWPHRATSRLCEAVRDHAPHLAPVEAVFEQSCTTGVLGENLFIDHCHPDPAGQRLLALAVADAIEDLRVAPPSGHRGQAQPLEAGLAAFHADAELLARGCAQVGRVFAGFALLREQPGPMAELAGRLLSDPDVVARSSPPELAASRALLAVARHDADDARAQLAAAAAKPAALGRLRLLCSRYPWIGRAFARLDLEEP